jgi:hypothetical protein
MFMFGTGFPARYSFHTLDTIYLFNTTQGEWAPSAVNSAVIWNRSRFTLTCFFHSLHSFTPPPPHIRTSSKAQ